MRVSTKEVRNEIMDKFAGLLKAAEENNEQNNERRNSSSNDLCLCVFFVMGFWRRNMTALYNPDGHTNKCPFCEGKETVIDFTGKYYRVLCLNSTCCATGPSKSQQDFAVGAWNLATQCQ